MDANPVADTKAADLGFGEGARAPIVEPNRDPIAGDLGPMIALEVVADDGAAAAPITVAAVPPKTLLPSTPPTTPPATAPAPEPFGRARIGSMPTMRPAVALGTWRSAVASGGPSDGAATMLSDGAPMAMAAAAARRGRINMLFMADS